MIILLSLNIILLSLTAAVVWWDWDSRLPMNYRPPSTYEDEDTDEE